MGQKTRLRAAVVHESKIASCINLVLSPIHTLHGFSVIILSLFNIVLLRSVFIQMPKISKYFQIKYFSDLNFEYTMEHMNMPK